MWKSGYAWRIFCQHHQKYLLSAFGLRKGAWHTACGNHLAFDPVTAKQNIKKTRQAHGLLHFVFPRKHVFPVQGSLGTGGYRSWTWVCITCRQSASQAPGEGWVMERSVPTICLSQGFNLLKPYRDLGEHQNKHTKCDFHWLCRQNRLTRQCEHMKLRSVCLINGILRDLPLRQKHGKVNARPPIRLPWAPLHQQTGTKWKQSQAHIQWVYPGIYRALGSKYFQFWLRL